MFDRLGAAIERHHTVPGAETAVPRLSLVVLDGSFQPADTLYEPLLCFVADGEKRTTAGALSEVAGPGEILLTPIDLPVSIELVKFPYRSVLLSLDMGTITELLMELEDSGAGAVGPPVRGLIKAEMTPQLVDAVTRWVELLDTPEDIGPLAGRIEAEILYRVLRCGLGPVLREWCLSDSAAARVRKAARWIRERYDQPLSVEEIAAVAHMSTAWLHRHFKEVTGMTPLRYQKRLRMQEARRRLVSGEESAAQVAQAVGYVSATQFSREYRSTYGLPPGQDAARLRAGRQSVGGIA
ncbi:AraC family transcriptional regulator [Streptomyces roseirectus]|uniref:AraC family transcriptional regulator n=1 Tax=Streptomyces roseirectus TaxID=2768066 RepID=A0A7H0IEY7_9ACTN|nr:AraC family transcriptional regulator [Streptomyces roseirectus]QNP71353.1 AraC family transcriptional regulator [Streptomyces roseirectus]